MKKEKYIDIVLSGKTNEAYIWMNIKTDSYMEKIDPDIINNDLGTERDFYPDYSNDKVLDYLPEYLDN